MVFSDLLFIFVFLPFFAITYLGGGAIDRWRILRADRNEITLRRPLLFRNISLIIFSLLFYSWGEPVYIALMLLTVMVNFIAGIFIGNTSLQNSRKIWLIVGVAANLTILASFKYLGFFASSLVSIGIPVPVPQIALPIGISFYIFQSISYLVDVYRRESAAQSNFFDLLLYIAMFPQLIAGPIVRYNTVAEEIHHRHASIADISEGTYRFFIGLGKKVIFANILGEIATALIGGSLDNLSAWEAWVGIIAFSLQIYFDFSGYSDMAIGLGRTVGFHFPENFRHPYTATSMTDFWRKWHISLGSFFRDYVYIPMGGNRKRQVINILTVWFLTGMWHGASWNFIIWGLYFGLIIMLEKYTILRWKIPRLFRYIYSIVLIIIGWGIFYFDDIGRLSAFYRAFFGLNHPAADGGGMPLTVQSLIFDNFWLWIAAIVLCLPIRRFIASKVEARAQAGPAFVSHSLLAVRAFICAAILVVSVALLVGATNNAFIYTRF